MTPDERKEALRLLTGWWPSPAVSDEEALVLGRALAGHEAADVIKAIDKLGDQGRTFRPHPSEVVAAVRQIRDNRLSREAFASASVLGLPVAREVPPNPGPYIAQCRRILATCHGPLAASLARTMDVGPLAGSTARTSAVLGGRPA